MPIRDIIILPVCFFAACSGPDDVPGGQGATSTGATEAGGGPPPARPPAPTTGDPPTTGVTSTGVEEVTTGTGAAPGVCGDGVIDPGEVCDDGEGNGPYEQCTPLCRLSVCGDGFVRLGIEECDEGAANVDTGHCRSDCRLAVCGDGLLFAALEECDAGKNNGPAYGGCDDDCTINRCGDGQLDAQFEECDEGADNGSGRVDATGMVGCDLECGLDGRRIFLSSQLFTGDMGTRAGADLACQNMAAQAKFRHPQRFRALLADATGGPVDYVEEDPGGRPFILPTGLIVATSFTMLIDEGPGDGITTTETGEVVLKAGVWTNLNPFGAAYLLAPDDTCANWTSANEEQFARIGENALPPGHPGLAKWTAERQWLSFFSQRCWEKYRVYCIEAEAA